ncbi:MAG TPA: hypothetical protein VFW41_11820 [Gaiellaceae bacterium]|nr:hypothetical protein [Gaiellaceae bacterium]
MKIILEPSDFPDTYYGDGEKSAEICVRRALDFAYTLEVMKQPDTPQGVSAAKATFHDIPRQIAVEIVGPVEVEFVLPKKPTIQNWKDLH